MTVRNTGSGSLDVTMLFEGSAAAMLTAAPSAFTLGSGEQRSVTLALAVASASVPGLHDSAVLARAAASGSGGTASPSVRAPLTFTVRALDVAAAGVQDASSFYVRVASGHDSAKSVTVNATLLSGAGPLWTRTSAAIALGADGSSVVFFAPPVQADGAFDLRLQAFEGATGLGVHTYRAQWSAGALASVDPVAPVGGGGGGAGGGGPAPPGPSAPAEPSEPPFSGHLVAPLPATERPVEVNVGDAFLAAVEVDLDAAYAAAELRLDAGSPQGGVPIAGFEALRLVHVDVRSEGATLPPRAFEGAAFRFDVPRQEALEREAAGQAAAAMDVATGERFVATSRSEEGTTVSYRVPVPHFSQWLLGFIVPLPPPPLEASWVWEGSRGRLLVAPFDGATWLVVELDGTVVYRGPFVTSPFDVDRGGLAVGEHTIRATVQVGSATSGATVPFTVAAAADPEGTALVASVVSLGVAVAFGGAAWGWQRFRRRPGRMPHGRPGGLAALPVRVRRPDAESAATGEDGRSVGAEVKPKTGRSGPG